MRTKLILRHPDGRTDAVLLATDTATTIGDVADLVAHGEGRVGGLPPRLRVWAPGNLTARTISRDICVLDSGLRSGSTIEVDQARPKIIQEPGPAAVRVQVLEGPDTGTTINLPSGVSIIGRSPYCAVRLRDRTVSKEHARLVVRAGSGVEIADNGSANGVGIGGGLVTRARLADGDCIQLGHTTMQVRWLTATAGVETNTVAFNRAPVVAPRVEAREIEAPVPPEPAKPQPLSWIAMLAPALLGGFTYALTHNAMTLAFVGLSPLMLLGTWVDRRRGERRRLARESAQFRADLEAMEQQVRTAQQGEAVVRRTEHPTLDEWMAAAEQLDPLLWSRRPDDEDFLTLRVGLGSDTSRITVTVAPRGRARSELWETLTTSTDALREVAGVPVVVDLRTCGSFGVAGVGEPADGVVRGLVCQLLAAHSPAQLRLAVLTSQASSVRWTWAPWLPHVGSTPWLASDPTSATATVTALEELVAERTGTHDVLPAVLVVVEDDAPAERGRLVRLAEEGPAVGVHVLWYAATVTRLPGACRAWVEVRTEGATLGLADEHRAHPVATEPAPTAAVWRFALHLSGVVDAGEPTHDETDLPRSVDFLSIAGAGPAEDPTTVLDQWHETDLTTDETTGRTDATLRAVVGQGPDGQFVLDLRSQGPHALVGGTTGSGKSEFLQTWVLGLATAHSPRRVTFLFVDYKGGAAFADCLDLPHCVGLVTDLTPHLVRRALTSLRAEITHRERLLAAAKAKDLVTMERAGDPRTPPALVIVVDEFAALVTDVPEFVDGMVDVAQRGRSLGLHLILATQRPAGVIKDNLRANTNLRIALRTADEHDSVDVVGLPVTAHLDPAIPGRAAVRTGPGRVTLFQTGYVGGRSGGRRSGPTIEIESLQLGPGRPWALTTGSASSKDDRGPTDLSRTVAQTVAAARQAGLAEPRRPWLPELEPAYDLTDLTDPARHRTARTTTGLPLGIVDLPDRQAQAVWTWLPDDGALAVFGTTGSGKSAALRTVAVAAGTAEPGCVHVYGLDFGSGGLAMIEGLPFVGSVVEANDVERVTRLLRDLLTLVEDRTQRFADARAGNLARYRELAGRPTEPRVYLLIDGMSAFRDAYETDTARLPSFATFRRILTEGRPLGVHVAVTAERHGSIPSSMISAIPVRLVLRQADQNTYRSLDVPADVLDTASPPGRAVQAGIAQELQLAVLGGDPHPPHQTPGPDPPTPPSKPVRRTP